MKTRLWSKISKFTGINKTSIDSAKSWTISDDGRRNINPPVKQKMWTAIRKDWDYLALTFVLGVYVTAAAAVAVTLMLTLSQSF